MKRRAVDGGLRRGWGRPAQFGAVHAARPAASSAPATPPVSEDRAASDTGASGAAAPAGPDPDTLRNRLVGLMAEQLGMAPSDIDPSFPLDEYGLDSVAIMRASEQLEDDYPDVPTSVFFEARTIDGLVDTFVEQVGASTSDASTSDASTSDASTSDASTNGASTNGTSTNGTSAKGAVPQDASANGSALRTRTSASVTSYATVVDVRSDADGSAADVRLSGTDPAIADHEIEGECLLSGAGIVHLVQEVYHHLTGRRVTSVRDVNWRRPLPVGADGTTATLRFAHHDGRADAFWVQHDGATTSRGKVVSDASVTRGTHEPVADVLDRTVEAYDGDALYRWNDQKGYHYGPAFQIIDRLHVAPGDVLAEVDVPDAGWSAPFVDGVFQAAVGLSFHGFTSSDRVRIPFYVGAIHAPTEALPDRLYVHARKTGSLDDDRMRRFDLRLIDADGRVYARVDDFTSRVVDAASEAASDAASDAPSASDSASSPAAPPPAPAGSRSTASDASASSGTNASEASASEASTATRQAILDEIDSLEQLVSLVRNDVVTVEEALDIERKLQAA